MMRDPMLAHSEAERWWQTSFFRIYLPTAICFFVINLTNTKVLHLLMQGHPGLIYGADADLAANIEKTSRFFLVPIKSFLFFIASAVLLFPLVRAAFFNMKEQLDRRQILQTAASLLLCLLLLATIVPTAMGRAYARVSIDPFNQVTDQLYRRLLLPALANLYHLDGFFYLFLFWAIVFVTALLVRTYFRSKGVDLSILQEVSLFTVGIFATAFMVPGYPEILVLLLALIALSEFERDGAFTAKQLAAFALALMAHETCAVIVFAPIILFVFGYRAWISSAAIGLLYGVALLANFSFHIGDMIQVQTSVSDLPASAYFLRAPGYVVLATVMSFKLLWLLLPIGMWLRWKTDRRFALFVLSALVLSVASTYIAIDYSRLIALATIPVLLCFVEVSRRLGARRMNILALANLILPTFYVGGIGGLATCKGLYYIAYRSLLHLPAPGF
jgi:hypothetical protein